MTTVAKKPIGSSINAITSAQLLSIWKTQKHNSNWAVGFLIERTGSSYRKPGAMMLFNDLGKHYGLLSGGCIEQQLNLSAKQVIEYQKSKIISYNLEDTDNPQEINWQTAIGCGGSLTILILPLSDTNDYLGLEDIYLALDSEQSCTLTIPATDTTSAEEFQAIVNLLPTKTAKLVSSANLDPSSQILTVEFHPPIRLFIAGAGQDAIPLANLAKELGWQVTINETRHRYQEVNHFPTGTKTLNTAHSLLTKNPSFIHCHCLIVMHHNLDLDRLTLAASIHSDAQYIGVLGPKSRLNKLIENAKLKEEDFKGRLHGPCGLNLGGDTPSAVALSILSHCHSILSGKNSNA